MGAWTKPSCGKPDEIASQPYQQIILLNAICINQKDVKERGEQVQIMGGSIYSTSEMTFAWLGTEDDVIDTA